MFLSFCIKRRFVIFTKELTKPFYKEHEIFIFLRCIIILTFFCIYFPSDTFGFLILIFLLLKSSGFCLIFLKFSKQRCGSHSGKTFLFGYCRHFWLPFPG